MMEGTASDEKHPRRYSRWYPRLHSRGIAQSSLKRRQDARVHAWRALKVAPAVLSGRPIARPQWEQRRKLRSLIDNNRGVVVAFLLRRTVHLVMEETADTEEDRLDSDRSGTIDLLPRPMLQSSRERQQTLAGILSDKRRSIIASGHGPMAHSSLKKTTGCGGCVWRLRTHNLSMRSHGKDTIEDARQDAK